MVEFILRDANSSDARVLFNNRNEITTRLNSVNSGIISYNKHKSWLLNAINDKNVLLFILQKNLIPLATSRLDIYENYIAISWSVFPEHRNNGYGKILIEKTLFKANKNVIAKIKESNLASINIAIFNGFVLLEQKEKFCYYIKYL